MPSFTVRVGYPSGAPDFNSGFHRGSCCPVMYVSLFPVIVLSFEFWVLIDPFVRLLDIYILYLYLEINATGEIYITSYTFYKFIIYCNSGNQLHISVMHASIRKDNY